MSAGSVKTNFLGTAQFFNAWEQQLEAFLFAITNGLVAGVHGITHNTSWYVSQSGMKITLKAPARLGSLIAEWCDCDFCLYFLIKTK